MGGTKVCNGSERDEFEGGVDCRPRTSVYASRHGHVSPEMENRSIAMK